MKKVKNCLQKNSTKKSTAKNASTQMVATRTALSFLNRWQSE